MTKPPPPSPALAQLRAEIDRLDAEMHRLLMARGEIIDRLVAVKKTGESGSAFRPAREADMMRRLVARHHGRLPLDTVESIWRVIIATFTWVQAPYTVHADFSAGEAVMRDVVRFHFGFTVPFVPHMGAAGAVAAVAASKGDLALVPAAGLGGNGAWWRALEADDAPKIIARLPFVERADHPAGLPTFVVARPAPDAVANEVRTVSVRVAGWGPQVAAALSPLVDTVAAPDAALDGAALLVSLPPGRTLEEVLAAMRQAGASVRNTALVGGHASRYTVASEGAAPVPAGR
ncbi:chorismate mutase [Blastochloris sulfoviridis]|uniref:chorismate mutase n=1 Tax=Blastochloris sulfoviridis TaxID=50712 RepID=A0A5M6I572_9HYPH|nr:chorismate mutase [Blastochloris sulfoviridis]KAA5603342.1 hypothetical protein F1193_01455 [Blastochloris sulfoviridis]